MLFSTLKAAKPLKNQPLMAALALLIMTAIAMPHKGLAQEQIQLQLDQKIASVNGEPVILREVLQAYEALPAEARQRGLDALYPVLLERVISYKLFTQAGEKAGLAKDAEVKAKLEEAEKAIIREVYVQRHIDKKLKKEDIEKAYNEWVSKNKAEEDLRARHILVATEETAKTVKEKLDKGADFAALASEYSIGPTRTQGGELGWFKPESMVKEFAQVALKLKAGQVSKPVKTRFGWHVIQLQDRRPGVAPTLAQFRQAYQRDKANQFLEELRLEKVKAAKVERLDLKGNPLPDPNKQ